MDSFLVNSIKPPPATHPFYPLGANVVGYLANEWSAPTLLGIFAGGWVVILGATLVLVRRHNPNLRSWDKATILWFVLSKSLQPAVENSADNPIHSWSDPSFF